MSIRSARGCRVALLMAAATTIAGVFALGGGAQAAQEAGSLRSATVDAKLRSQLAADPTGGVTAIVTTWNRDGLDDVVGITGGTKLKLLPMVITSTLTVAQLQQLESSPQVRRVWGERKYDLYMEDTTWITKARYVWSTSTTGPDTRRGFGITGKGAELAVIDTGFDGKHEDGDNLIEFCNSMGSANAVRAEVVCTPW